MSAISGQVSKRFNNHKRSLNRYGNGQKEICGTHISVQRGIWRLKIFRCRLSTTQIRNDVVCQRQLTVFLSITLNYASV